MTDPKQVRVVKKDDLLRMRAVEKIQLALENAYGSAHAAQLLDITGLREPPTTGNRPIVEVEDMIARDIIRRLRTILSCPETESILNWAAKIVDKE